MPSNSTTSAGQVSGQVITAAFGVFSPDAVVPAVERGWAIADVEPVHLARQAAQVRCEPGALRATQLGPHGSQGDSGDVATATGTISIFRS